ncbi:hypothetical protein [Oceanobacter sp. 3_MG-2023]|uniref:hypothetical protein n=1 Tax=Oceanobacter sp. 3_MG-2023 TaxID=3062622 RepID=UPI002734B0E8|nr:hypothetical protein [Oceanobacter sp. 3_MG-2023]MDP2506717.1 hypothetical protein [Oceanobacter sp. 3_MG-2023]
MALSTRCEASPRNPRVALPVGWAAALGVCWLLGVAVLLRWGLVRRIGEIRLRMVSVLLERYAQRQRPLFQWSPTFKRW